MVSTYSANVRRPPGISRSSMGPLVLLQLFILLHSGDAITRTFYIAAVERFWNYKEGTTSSLGQREIVKATGAPIYKKAIYMEYSDASFTNPKPREPWTGLLGPVIRLETFDSAVIHFKNLASIPYSLHGISVSYTKRSEGAGYEDGTNKLEKVDDAIPPGQEYIYTWDIPEGYGPVESDPPCITSAYHSHSNTSYDINSGLVGVLLICKPGSLSEDGSQYGVQEKIIVLAVFDERLSHYNNGLEDTPLHTINGFINGSIPEQTMCVKKPAYFNVIGFGTHGEVHRFSLEGHSFVIGEHRVPILPVTAFSFFTAMVNPGEKEVYRLSCQTRTHPEGRMTSLVKVEDCIREPETRSHIPGDDDDDYEEEDDYYESMVLDIEDDPTHVDPRSHSKRNPVTWVHYIAAIEVDWDYQPTRNDKRNRFTKVLYREFTNSEFTHQKPSEIPGTGILGPVLRGEVGDQIKIVFKNLAHRPFNLYPQGLSSVSSNHPSMAGEQLRDYPVYPNDSITYIWQVTPYDSPASSDPRCLTRFYSSFLNLQKDLASGLIGPLLICSKQTLDRAGNQIITDKENILFFCIFNETLSWYHEEDRQQSAVTSSEDKGAIGKPPGSSLIYTINGILDSLQLSICQSEVSVWHVLNLGLGTELISIYFGGNTFMVDSSYQETLTLIPMNGKTVIMVMEKTGQWHVAPDSPLADLGMRATLKVIRCEHHEDDYYEYNHEESKDFTPDPTFYQFPLIAPFKTPPSGPQSYLQKSPTPEYLDDGILNDEDSTKALQPVGSTETQSGKVKGEPAKELNRQRRDTTGQIGPAKKLLENGSHANNSADGNVDFYDDYSGDFEYIDLYGELDPRSHVGQIHTYFIAAEEIEWDYGGGQSPYFIKDSHHMLHGFPSYKKVVFREYLDSSFREPAFRGERDAHLGLLGPCIRAEVNDEIIIQFKNMASRPYSFYSNVLAVQWKEEDSVPPQHSRTYTGKVSSQFGPTGSEECRTWFYTSNGHLYKDFHSGLIGPLLVCRPNVLKRSTVQQIPMEDFSLVFMEIDEMKSWYFRENWQRRCPSTCGFQANVLRSCPRACKSPSAAPAEDIQHDHIFHAINGYVDDSLPGLVLPLDRKTRWHLLNVGRRDILPVQFHGNILKQGSQKDHPCSIVNLYPGVGVTLEMTAQATGLWLIEPEGEYNNHNMTALYLVYNPRCHQPLGLSSGKIKDLQITASGHYGSWVPFLARLGNSGTINAWSVDSQNSWIQVDLLAPMVIHAIQTQGARQKFLTLYISQYIIFYSLNGEKWSQYQGNTSSNQMVFFGNVDASSIRENSFNPPIIARFIRIHPVHTGSRAGLRMELFGCDLTSCFMSLGMQSGAIIPYQLSASSSLHSVFSSWVPNLARLKQQGRINAWRPQADRPGEWFQIDLGREMKVTGIMIQGARSFSSMYITEFSLSFSNDGLRWTAVQSSDGQRQIFPGNKDSDTPMWVTMEAPGIARFLKLHPEKWKGGIALRMEVLGCGV
ncbi:coagulation factor VIII [Rana temporaria]|uniref:coagulation factor VIII n=1 Tax=Rana temporaria TaxID=8407 RepID=UPI001AACC843|nr:coagulation factor VIII [Rana temporaria]